MGIDLRLEEVITLAQAAEALPRMRKGKPIHRSTLYRWIQRGVDGVKLEAARIGRGTVTSIEALQRFMDRLSPSRAEEAAAPIRSEAEMARVEEKLRRYGL